ncbi:MAG: hypothetical protein IJ521_01005, partial [Schwartzia sp.]|nr:hypothetical protein [Schwartzia sp. (in: firmicutes)]
MKIIDFVQLSPKTSGQPKQQQIARNYKGSEDRQKNKRRSKATLNLIFGIENQIVLKRPAKRKTPTGSQKINHINCLQRIKLSSFIFFSITAYLFKPYATRAASW